MKSWSEFSLGRLRDDKEDKEEEEEEEEEAAADVVESEVLSAVSSSLPKPSLSLAPFLLFLLLLLPLPFEALLSSPMALHCFSAAADSARISSIGIEGDIRPLIHVQEKPNRSSLSFSLSLSSSVSTSPPLLILVLWPLSLCLFDVVVDVNVFGLGRAMYTEPGPCSAPCTKCPSKRSPAPEKMRVVGP